MGTGRRFETLDGLRGVAAAAVVLFHFGGWTGRPWLVPHGYLAVDLFFALSGFVIAHAYEWKLPELGKRGFLKARIVRLWPLILLGAMLGAYEQAVRSDRTVSGWGILTAFVSACLLLPHSERLMMHGAPYPLNGPAWSLTFEALVNLAWVFAAPWLSNRVLGLTILVAGVWLAVWGASVPLADLGTDQWLGGFPRVVFTFGLGLACYRMRDLSPVKLPAWALSLGVLGLFWLPALPGWADVLLILVAVPPLILLGAASPSCSWLLRWSGELSFPVYALHAPIGLLLVGRLDWWVLAPILGLSLLALLAYDQPFRRRLRPSPIRAALPATP